MAATAPIRISSEEAVEKVTQIEREVRSIGEKADLNVVQVREDYVLPASAADWANAFVSRLVMFNKEHRRSVRQSMQGYHHHYTLLFRNDDADPMKSLLAQSTEAIRSSREVKELYAKFQDLYQRRCANGSLLMLDRAMVVRAMARLKTSVEIIETGETYIRQGLDYWKSSFMVLFMKKHLEKALDALQSRKVTKIASLEQCSGLFDRLASLHAEQQRTLCHIGNEATLLTVVFFTVSQSGVSNDYLEEKLRAFATARNTLLSIISEQDEIIQKIHTLAEDARSSPTTLPGPDDVEIPIKELLRAGEQFERIRINCVRIQELAIPTMESLTTMLRNLDNGPMQIVISVR
ncbi:hypothetical protein FKP32DRAFT_1753487 [Trametes sanguinea]|nr:hypothetical protein FKP32DRAFT_1753498 [Trametes sanguinea]KAI9070074.1 hypothetical protein FKP32DRAFT_1753487 [Trametes sanguinea]